MVYYRYLYFTENGRVLYALTVSPPHEMVVRLRRAWVTGQSDACAVWGTYTVQKTRVTVRAQQEWQHVQLALTIDVSDRSYGCLSFDHHMSSLSGDFSDTWRSDRIIHEVPEEPFRFVKDNWL
jgi:F-box protein 9